MAGKWKIYSLGELCRFITDGKHGDCRNEYNSGFYFLSVKDIFGDRMVYENARQITETDFIETHRRTNLEPGDVLFTNTGTIGRMAIAPDDPKTERTTFQKSVAILKPKREIVLSRFLYFALRFDNERLSDFAAGTTQKNLLLKDLRTFTIHIPPLPTQKAIAHILGTLDDKIELNRRMNKTLEEMARAIFKSWFVDFDPVRAKMDGRQPVGMDELTAALFPDGFQDSELGQIPGGWEVKPLSELCTLGRGASPRPINDYMNGEVPWVKIADATATDGPFLFETKEKVKRAGAEKSVSVVPGDLILSNSATCGVPIFVELYGCIHDGWLYFKNLRSISKLYLFHILVELAEHLVHIADGSVQKNLNTNLVGQQMVLVPPISVVEAFNLQATRWFAKIRQNGLESRTLATLRDTLLPKLLSGELSVVSFLSTNHQED